MNTLAVLDAATNTIKTKMFQKMTRQNTKNWGSMLQTIQGSYNSTIHGSIIASPNDMERDSKAAKQLQFEREKQAATNIEHNSELLAAKDEVTELKHERSDLTFKIGQLESDVEQADRSGAVRLEWLQKESEHYRARCWELEKKLSDIRVFEWRTPKFLTSYEATPHLCPGRHTLEDPESQESN